MSVRFDSPTQGRVFPFLRPQNIVAPSIDGFPLDGLRFTLRLGVWSGSISSFEAEVVDQTGAVIMPRQPVTNGTTFPSAGLVGKTPILRVWALTNIRLPSLPAVSAPFGPIMAGDQFIGAVAYVATAEDAAALSSFEMFPILPLYRDGTSGTYVQGLFPTANPNWPGLFYGQTTNNGAVTAMTPPSGDVRRQARLSGSISMVQGCALFEVPSAGNYLVYGSAGGTSVLNGNWNITDGDPRAAGSVIRYEQGPTALAAQQFLDPAGNVRTYAQWIAASPFGGTPVEVTSSVVQSGRRFIAVGRRTGATATNLNYIAVFRRAA